MLTEADVVEVRIDPLGLKGLLGVPEGTRGMVIFAHGSGSGRLSPRNNYVADQLRRRGLATFLLDLLTRNEEADRSNVFDVGLLAVRLGDATEWIVDGAGHLFEEPGTMEQVVDHAADWFLTHLDRTAAGR